MDDRVIVEYVKADGEFTDAVLRKFRYIDEQLDSLIQRIKVLELASQGNQPYTGQGDTL